jgi:tetratricopeptide (TPR) repeat protein
VDPAERLAGINALEERLLNSGAQADSVPLLVDELLTQSLDFVDQFPQDSAAGRVLFRAANVAHGAGSFDQAIDLWGRVVRDYPDYAQGPDALFLQGFTADKDLQDVAMAISHYEAFLQQFPDHQLARDVALLLQLLQSEQRPEDLIRTFPTGPDTTETGPE